MKWFLAIPHYFVLIVLNIAAFGAVIVAWFAILFTGRYPGGCSTSWRASSGGTTVCVGYSFTLVTDQYPPFSLHA